MALCRIVAETTAIQPWIWMILVIGFWPQHYYIFMHTGWFVVGFAKLNHAFCELSRPICKMSKTFSKKLNLLAEFPGAVEQKLFGLIQGTRNFILRQLPPITLYTHNGFNIRIWDKNIGKEGVLSSIIATSNAICCL